jgi:hypothetical protein
MSAVTFPFLLLTRRSSFRSVTTDGGNLAVGFTTSSYAARFMEARSESNWEFLLIVRSGLKPVIDDLRKGNLEGICIDPEPDESGGHRVTVDDLLKLAVE